MMMSEDNKTNSIQAKNCCRLCLAPNSECISIINSFAADKEPLAKKIQNCVSIKVLNSDRLSLCICHACISYLNSWQSFKNRCLAAQQKQLLMLDKAKTTETDFTTQHQQNGDDMKNMQELGSSFYNDQSHLSSTILDGISTLKKRKSITVYSVPAVQVKEEPLDEPDEYDCKNDESDDMMMDPTMFLERTAEVGDEPLMEYDTMHHHHQHNDENQHMDNDFEHQQQQSLQRLAANESTKEASCRACNLKFSTRANARRHERNLHPNLFELAPDTSSSSLTTKPIQALTAALELQRAAANAAAAEASKAGISPQKFRQEVLNAFNKTEGTDMDYEQPEKYQHLLTDEKIIFIQQNEDFLQQYQTMTCRCCNKFFNTYKNFMAHMRKKYPTLPRNLCFNCLKLNYSKALFISHLKKRNCINMYKIMHSLMAKSSSFAAAVTASVASTTEKLRAKELLVNKMYECKLCAKLFRLKHEFRSHVYEKHGDVQRKDTDGTQCSFCGLENTDPVERKRHNNNMDCLVSLCCLTCDTKFDGNQKFLDHVQETHLKAFEQQQMQQNDFAAVLNLGRAPSVSTDETRSNNTTTPPTTTTTTTTPKGQYFSRMPQACPICGQRYNNYNNVLRHMESKHPDQLPQTYKCVRCGVGYPRLSNLREHMSTVHNEEKVRHSGFEYIVNADATKIKDNNSGNSNSGGGGAYSGRYDYVMKDLLSITNGGNMDDLDDESSESAAKKIRLDNNGSVKSGENLISSIKTCPICNASFSNNIGLSNHMRSHTAASQNAATLANLSAVTRTTPKSLTITPVPAASLGSNSNSASNAINHPTNTPNQLQNQTPEQQMLFRRSLEQAADRRFRRMRCRFCQKRFSSKKSYRQHMIADHNVHNVQFIKCKLCSAEFAQEKGLKVHMFKIHNTLLKDDALHEHIQYECDICSTVYRTEDELILHKKNTHNSSPMKSSTMDGEASLGALETTSSVGGGDLSGISTPIESAASSTNGGGIAAGASATTHAAGAAANAGPLYWYQCKYCPSNFNTNKKLAIHINSHDEFDSKDYSCKDCGNVYSGRKSLWVHRYKKHPQIPDPSECVLCKKMFFDAQMLENHLPSCNRKPITNTGSLAQPDSQPMIFKHKTGDDEEDDPTAGNSNDALQQQQQEGNDNSSVGGGNNNNNGQLLGTLGGGQVEVSAMPTPVAPSNLKIKLPEVACTMCGARFSDQDLFAAHIKKHEMELYTDNPLAAMFDTEPIDPRQFFLDRQNESGEYACDLCTKAFTNVVALKVHRKWHFRGDSKQNLNLNNNKSNANTNNNSNSQKISAHNKVQQQNITNQKSSSNSNTPTSINNNNNNSITWSNTSIKKENISQSPSNSNPNPNTNLNSNSSTNSITQQSASQISNTTTATSSPTMMKNPQHQQGSDEGALSTKVPYNQQQQQEVDQHHRVKAVKRKREVTCNFCPSTFTSNNNLRRHLHELHKDEINDWPQPPLIQCDEPLHCRRCEMKFETKAEYIEHKINDARTNKSHGPFEWGCEICGVYLSRKEKLLSHINTHLKEEVNADIPMEQYIYEEDEEEEAAHKRDLEKRMRLNDEQGATTSDDDEEDEDDDTDEDDDDDDEEEDEEEEEEEEEEEDDEEISTKPYKVQPPSPDDQDMDSLDIEAENEVAEVEIEAKHAMSAKSIKLFKHHLLQQQQQQPPKRSHHKLIQRQPNLLELFPSAYTNDTDDEDEEEDDNDEDEDVNIDDNSDVDVGDDNEDDDEDEEEEEEEEEDDDDEDDDLTDAKARQKIKQINENANHDDNLSDVDVGDDNEDDDDDDDDDTDDEDDDEQNMVIEEGMSAHANHKDNKSLNETSEAEDSPSYIDSDDDDDANNVTISRHNSGYANHHHHYNNNNDDEDDDDDDDGEDTDTDIGTDSNQSHGLMKSPLPPKAVAAKKHFSCDLCSVFFESQLELQKHVKMHFLNGPGSVSFAKTTFKRSNSGSSTNDVVAVNSL